MSEYGGRKLIDPLTHYDENGRVIIAHEIGDPSQDQEIINRWTPGAVAGDKLFKRIGGYDLYTDITDTIVIDRRGANIFIFKDKIEEDITPAAEREYLLLLVGLEDTDFEDTFRGVVGRQNVFETILGIIDLIDLHESKILAETTQLKGAISIYQFMRMCVDKNLVDNPDRFDPYDWEDTVYEDMEE